MKIVIFITRGDSIGGAQTHVIDIARIFKSNGHDVLVCFGGKREGPFMKLLIAKNIDFVNIECLKREISPIADFISILKLNKILKQYSPDVLSLHSSKAGILGRICGFVMGIPVVLTIHGWSFTEGVNKKKAIFYKFLEKYLAKLVTKFIVVSNYDKEIALKNNITQEKKLTVIHNGIEINEFKKKAIRKEVIDIVMVARFDEQKDHLTLIRALTNAKYFKLHLLGDGPNLQNIKNLVNKSGISEKVIFYGYSNQVTEILRESDIFILTSNWEGFPISTLEAMNYELPVIVSNVGGATEAILHGVTGFSVEKNDAQALRKFVDILSENHDVRIKMGKDGKNILTNNFSVEKMYQKVLLVYNEVTRR